MLLDLDFTYKNTIRYILINKLGIKNTHKIPIIKKLLFYFLFKKLEDLNSIQIFNTFYLFKYFLGWNAFFSKTKSYFSLNKWYYNLNVKIILDDTKEILYIYSYLLNNIWAKIDKNYIKKGILMKNINIYYLIMKDINRFSELKINLGLFYLNKPLITLIYVKGCNKKDKIGAIILFKNMKL